MFFQSTHILILAALAGLAVNAVPLKQAPKLSSVSAGNAAPTGTIPSGAECIVAAHSTGTAVANAKAGTKGHHHDHHCVEDKDHKELHGHKKPHPTGAVGTSALGRGAMPTPTSTKVAMRDAEPEDKHTRSHKHLGTGIHSHTHMPMGTGVHSHKHKHEKPATSASASASATPSVSV
ncbi:hypothetical protein MMC06_006207 [Schaereria dolodes]|nr:hypothetical protein [Schaereria dolodes]